LVRVKYLILLSLLVLLSCKRITPKTIPFQTITGMPIIEIDVNGKRGRLLIDTGAGMSLIDSTASQAYGYKLFKNMFVDMKIEGIGGTKNAYLVNNIELSHNGTKINVYFESSDLRFLYLRHGVIGIIGSDFLIQNNIIIDYQNNIIRTSTILD